MERIEPKLKMDVITNILEDGSKIVVLNLHTQESGLYELGNTQRIGVTIDINHKPRIEHGRANRVVLDLTQYPELQGAKGKQQRIIGINPQGIGATQISKDITLWINIGKATHCQYTNATPGLLSVIC